MARTMTGAEMVVTKLGGRRVLELVIDRATGSLRAVERLVD